MGIYGFDSGSMEDPIELDVNDDDFYDKVLPAVDEMSRRAWGRNMPYVKTGTEQDIYATDKDELNSLFGKTPDSA